VAVINRSLSVRPCRADQDWHPSGHSSFATSHPVRLRLKPSACFMGADAVADHLRPGHAGAAFHRQLATEGGAGAARVSVRNRFLLRIHENDRYADGLAGYLRERGLQRIFLRGSPPTIASYYSAMDARRSASTPSSSRPAQGIDLAGSLGAAWAAMPRRRQRQRSRLSMIGKVATGFPSDKTRSVCPESCSTKRWSGKTIRRKSSRLARDSQYASALSGWASHGCNDFLAQLPRSSCDAAAAVGPA